jgi:hypothetical protein
VRTLTIEWKQILQEIIELSNIPPDVDDRPVFVNGGYGFRESWNDIEKLFQ